MEAEVQIRRATLEDAPAIAAIWEVVVGERRFTAVNRPFTLEQEREYMASLSPREAIFMATLQGGIIGFQALDRWAKYTDSMDHVGALGTVILPPYRGRGIGRRLAQAVLDFAREKGYEKLIVYVRAGNEGALAFYRSLGFVPIARLARQVKIDGLYEDEILMERFLTEEG